MTASSPARQEDLEATVLRPLAAWQGSVRPASARPSMAAGTPLLAPLALPSPSLAPSLAPALALPSAAAPSTAATAATAPASHADAGAGLGPLMASAAPLVHLVPRLRDAPPPGDIAPWRCELLQRVAAFDQQASASGVPAATRHAARYALCTWLDETLARTRWGAAADWTRQGLLVTLHQEGFGGEKMFALAERVLREPWRHAELVELLAVMLALGFEGRHAVQPDGRAHLDAWRDRLHAALRSVRGPAPDLSPPRSQPAPAERASRLRWGVGGLTFAVLVVALGADQLAVRRLHRLTAPIASRLEGLQPVALASRRLPARPPDAPAPLRLRLRRLLAPEVAAGRLEVDESGPRALVTLVGDRCFAPGRADLDADLLPVLQAIAQAIDQVPGRVLVTGHTDATPLRGHARYPDNAALSLARAQGAAAVLAGALRDPARVRARGVGSTQPRAPEDSALHRALNRRVELTVEDGP